MASIPEDLEVRRLSARAWIGGTSGPASFVRMVLSLGLFIGLWELLARTVLTNRLIIVPFSEVVAELLSEMESGAFWRHSAATGLELLIAFPIAVVSGIFLGVIVASAKPVRQTLAPLFTAMDALPTIALAPLFIAALGFGVSSKVAIIILMAIFPMIANTETGLRSADSDLIEVAHSFRASRLQILRWVTFPYALPFIIGGIRVSFARALVAVIVAEFFGAFSGYGFAIMAASNNYQTARILGYVMVLGAVGLVASVGLSALERKMSPWRET